MSYTIINTDNDLRRLAVTRIIILSTTVLIYTCRHYVVHPTIISLIFWNKFLSASENGSNIAYVDFWRQKFVNLGEVKQRLKTSMILLGWIAVIICIASNAETESFCHDNAKNLWKNSVVPAPVFFAGTVTSGLLQVMDLIASFWVPPVLLSFHFELNWHFPLAFIDQDLVCQRDTSFYPRVERHKTWEMSWLPFTKFCFSIPYW